MSRKYNCGDFLRTLYIHLQLVVGKRGARREGLAGSHHDVVDGHPSIDGLRQHADNVHLRSTFRYENIVPLGIRSLI